MSWCLGKEQRTTERFPHHAHYIRHCPSSSESMIILFALVLWKPFWLSYQHRPITIDTGCDVTQAALTWIIHGIYLLLGIESLAPTCSWIFTCSSVQLWFEWDFIDPGVRAPTARGRKKPASLCFNEKPQSGSLLMSFLHCYEIWNWGGSVCMSLGLSFPFFSQTYLSVLPSSSEASPGVMGRRDCISCIGGQITPPPNSPGAPWWSVLSRFPDLHHLTSGPAFPHTDSGVVDQLCSFSLNRFISFC